MPESFIKDLENVINKYQISVTKSFSMNYLTSLFSDKNIKLTDMVTKTNDGYNPNEVVLASKKSEKMSFFEKFFHFFS